MRKLYISSLLAVLGGVLAAPAQNTLGLAASNYGGTHSVYLNPALLADSRMGFHLDLATVQGGANNNYIGIPFGIGKLLGSEISLDGLPRRQNGRPKFINVAGQARIFSLMVKLSPKHSLAFTNRVRYGVSGSNISEQLADMIVTGTDAATFMGKSFNGISANLNVNAYKETGLSYGRVILDTKGYRLKGGITVNRLSGFTAAHFSSRNLSFSVSDRPDPEMPAERQEVINIQNIDVAYGFVGEEAFEKATDNPGLGTFFGAGLPGRGWGLNLGATFEKLEDDAQDKAASRLMDSLGSIHKGKKLAGGSRIKMRNTYKYRVGASLMDVGGLRYSGPSVESYAVARTNKQLVAEDLEGGQDDIVATLNDALDVQPSERSSTLRTGLPTAFHAFLDYHVKGKLYASAVWVQSLRGRNATGLRQPSLLSVTPRLEMRWFELAMPVSVVNNYSGVALGLYAKLGVLHVGSDNLLGAIGAGTNYGLDAYAGLSIPVFAKTKN